MTNRKSEKNSEIWLKYCEECVKSKLEDNEVKLTDTLDEDSFKIKLEKHIDDAVAKISADNNLPDMIEELDDLLNQIGAKKIIDRIKFLEKNITQSSYPAVNDVISEEPQEESTDGNN